MVATTISSSERDQIGQAADRSVGRRLWEGIAVLGVVDEDDGDARRAGGHSEEIAPRAGVGSHHCAGGGHSASPTNTGKNKPKELGKRSCGFGS